MQPKVLGGSSDENVTLTLPGFEVAKAPQKILGINHTVGIWMTHTYALLNWQMDDE